MHSLFLIFTTYLVVASARPKAANNACSLSADDAGTTGVGNTDNTYESDGNAGTATTTAFGSQGTGEGHSSTGGNGSGGNINTSDDDDLGTTNGTAAGGSLSRDFSSMFTAYGSSVGGGKSDGNCKIHENACGNNPQSGFTAAASAFLYYHGADGSGIERDGHPGATCGTCWSITGKNKGTVGKTMVVFIDNECGRDPVLLDAKTGKPKNCNQRSLTDLNLVNAEITIDLCNDTGASMNFFGVPSGESEGTAHQVSCDNWCGVLADGTKKGPEGCTPGQMVDATNVE